MGSGYGGVTPCDSEELRATLIAAIPSIFFSRIPELRHFVTFGGNPLGSMDLVHTVCKDIRGTINFWSPELRLGSRLHNDIVMLILPFLPWCESPRLVNVNQAWREALWYIAMTDYRDMFRPSIERTVVSWQLPLSFGSAELYVVPPLVWAALPVTEVPFNAEFDPPQGVLSVREEPDPLSQFNLEGRIVRFFSQKLPVFSAYGHLEEVVVYRGKDRLYLCPQYIRQYEPTSRAVFALKALREGWCVCHCAEPLRYKCEVTDTLHFCSGKMPPVGSH